MGDGGGERVLSLGGLWFFFVQGHSIFFWTFTSRAMNGGGVRRARPLLLTLVLACAGHGAASPVCSSGIEGDDATATCFGWCDPILAADHCKWCKVQAGRSRSTTRGTPTRARFSPARPPRLTVSRLCVVRGRENFGNAGRLGARDLASVGCQRCGLQGGAGGRADVPRLPGLLRCRGVGAALPALQVQGLLVLRVPVGARGRLGGGDVRAVSYCVVFY